MKSQIKICFIPKGMKSNSYLFHTIRSELKTVPWLWNIDGLEQSSCPGFRKVWEVLISNWGDIKMRGWTVSPWSWLFEFFFSTVHSWGVTCSKQGLSMATLATIMQNHGNNLMCTSDWIQQAAPNRGSPCLRIRKDMSVLQITPSLACTTAITSSCSSYTGYATILRPSADRVVFPKL